MPKNLKQKLDSYKFGIIAEFLVIIFLKLKLYKIIARRYKTKFGEIDIIASKSKTLIAIEVKARKVRREEILIEEMLRRKQLERVKMATQFFLAKNKKYRDLSVRFDFVFVGKNYLPKHYRSFWD